MGWKFSPPLCSLRRNPEENYGTGSLIVSVGSERIPSLVKFPKGTQSYLQANSIYF